MLQGGGHFTAVVKFPNSWLYYDGLGVERGQYRGTKRERQKFQFYPLNEAIAAMNGRVLDIILYEVVEESAEPKGDASIDYGKFFWSINKCPVKNINKRKSNAATKKGEKKKKKSIKTKENRYQKYS